MPRVRIYRPAKNALQSGTANTSRWIAEFEPEAAKKVDPLMGWTGSADTRQQVRLRFDGRDQAIAYAERNGFDYEVEEPAPRVHVRKNYADKFAWKPAG